MLVVLLSKAFHRAEVTVLEHQLMQGKLPRLWLQRSELEPPLLAQRERDDPAIPVPSLEQLLVVCVPTKGVPSILVQVEVARVGPEGGVRQAAEWHVVLHDVNQPWWEVAGLHDDPTVAIVARAWSLDEPSGLPRLGTPRAGELLPRYAAFDIEEEAPERNETARVASMSNVAAPGIVPDGVVPIDLCRSNATKKCQAGN